MKFVHDSWTRKTNLVNSSSLDSKLVLIDGNDLFVDQDRLILGPDGSQVDGHQEGGGEDCPHGHLGLAPLVTQAEVSDDELQTNVRDRDQFFCRNSQIRRSIVNKCYNGRPP